MAGQEADLPQSPAFLSWIALPDSVVILGAHRGAPEDDERIDTMSVPEYLTLQPCRIGSESEGLLVKSGRKA
ncbi:hypothetical protein LBMAG48_10650 [Phycisphaerae bacterium]|nr:hypothetical protein LBMAG48_10650 [Phycisphaerae bacterium]